MPRSIANSAYLVNIPVTPRGGIVAGLPTPGTLVLHSRRNDGVSRCPGAGGSTTVGRMLPGAGHVLERPGRTAGDGPARAEWWGLPPDVRGTTPSLARRLCTTLCAARAPGEVKVKTRRGGVDVGAARQSRDRPRGRRGRDL